MRKNTFILFGVVILFVAGCVVYFKQVKKEIPPVTEPVVEIPVTKPVSVEPQEYCFYKETVVSKTLKDVMWLKITVMGTEVTGDLHMIPAEKDKKFGTFSGNIGGMDPVAMSGYSDMWWNANAEGTTQKEELRVALANSEKGAEASVAFGAMTQGTDGAYIYKDKENLTYQSIPQVGCTQFNSLIKNAFVDTTKTFTFDYLKDFTATNKIVKNSTDWSVLLEGAKGDVLAIVTVPKGFQPGTNFSEAKFTVGVSSDKKAVDTCIKNDGMNADVPVRINGIDFMQFALNDAAAGNRYDTVSYRTVFKNKCYAVETLVHYTNIGNYSPDQGIKEFDRGAIDQILENMVNSFIFTGSSKPALL